MELKYIYHLGKNEDKYKYLYYNKKENKICINRSNSLSPTNYITSVNTDILIKELLSKDWLIWNMEESSKIIFSNNSNKKEMVTFNFSVAMIYAKQGCKIARTKWNDKMYIIMLNFNNESKFFLTSRYHLSEQWIASEEDLIANDWYIVK